MNHPTSNAATSFGKLSRAELMSRVRSKGNNTTEGRTISLLRAAHVTGWRRHVQLPGNPDFIWRKARVALFVDGCFWHGHNCGRNLTPKTNADLWERKITATRRRDAANGRLLRDRGWRVIRIWECQLKASPDACLERICSALKV
jgi:DNA mismatch endonuclease (patch repair protein)